MNEADNELFLMVSLINYTFPFKLKKYYIWNFQKIFKIIKQDSKTQSCGHAQVEMALRQFQFRITVLNISSEKFFQKN